PACAAHAAGRSGRDRAGSSTEGRRGVRRGRARRPIAGGRALRKRSEKVSSGKMQCGSKSSHDVTDSPRGCVHRLRRPGSTGAVIYSRFPNSREMRQGMPLNIPNTLTWARIVMIPIFVGIFYLPDALMPVVTKNLVATLIFVAAAVTDWFDGYLARALGQTSAFGAFLDPVADKLMVAAALILLVQLARVDALIAVVIIGREITISALREWMARVGKSASVAVAYVGKLKT